MDWKLNAEIARALGLPEDVIKRAAAVTLRLRVGRAPTITVMMLKLDGVSTVERFRVVKDEQRTGGGETD